MQVESSTKIGSVIHSCGDPRDFIHAGRDGQPEALVKQEEAPEPDLQRRPLLNCGQELLPWLPVVSGWGRGGAKPCLGAKPCPATPQVWLHSPIATGVPA